MAKRGYDSPWGLNRWILLLWYSFVLFFVGNWLSGIDAARRLLHLHGTGSDFIESEFDRKVALESLLNVSFGSTAAISWFMAHWSARHGPRWSGTAGILLYVAGCILLFYADLMAVNYLGAVMMGSAFSVIFNAHASLTSLFPASSEIVFDLLGMGPELANLIPLCLLYFSGGKVFGLFEILEKSSVLSVDSIVQIYIIIILFILLVHVTLLPSDNYSKLVSKKYRAAMSAGSVQKSHLAAKYVRDRQFYKNLERMLTVQDKSAHVLADLTFMQQIFHPFLYTSATFFTLNLIRKYHFLATFRPTVETYAASTGFTGNVDFMIDMMNVATILSSIPTLIFMRNVFGSTSAASNLMVGIFAAITFVTMAIPNVYIQWITILSYFMWASMIYTALYQTTMEYFGAKNCAHLQGMQLIVSGITVLVHPTIMEWLGFPFLQEDKIEVAQLISKVQITMAILSVLAVLIPLYHLTIFLPYVKNQRTKRDSVAEPGDKQPQSSEVIQDAAVSMMPALESIHLEKQALSATSLMSDKDHRASLSHIGKMGHGATCLNETNLSEMIASSMVTTLNQRRKSANLFEGASPHEITRLISGDMENGDGIRRPTTDLDDIESNLRHDDSSSAESRQTPIMIVPKSEPNDQFLFIKPEGSQ